MIRLQKRLRQSRNFQAVSRGFISVPLLLYAFLWFLPSIWNFFEPMSHNDREGLWGYSLFLHTAGLAGAPFLLIPLGAWAVFAERCRRLEKRLSDLAALIQ